MEVILKIVEQSSLQNIQDMLGTHDFTCLKDAVIEFQSCNSVEKTVDFESFRRIMEFLYIEEFYDLDSLQYSRLSSFLRKTMGRSVFEVWSLQEGLEIAEELEWYFPKEQHSTVTDFLQHNLTEGRLAVFLANEISREGYDAVPVF